MIRQPLSGNGMCYRRFNKSLNNWEYLAYAGYATEWTSRADFYGRYLMINTQFHRHAIHLKRLTNMYLFTKIDQLIFNPNNPTYDIYIYHGCLLHCLMPPQAEIVISISFDDTTYIPVSKTYFDYVNDINQNSGTLIRSHIDRINLESLFDQLGNCTWTRYF